MLLTYMNALETLLSLPLTGANPFGDRPNPAFWYLCPFADFFAGGEFLSLVRLGVLGWIGNYASWIY
jgi:hypothetical protein